MQKYFLILFGTAVLTGPMLGCGGGTETTEIAVTPYDQSVEDRMAERGAEMMSEAERRKTAQ
ncbi:hypothetical protein [Neorhodopirellula pilleata]|uniref:Uncharacterized protein n=1 Tax=Neorhodopirellula pilleata TaxID=2714738 RepID=A0A5C6A5V7_9BACT|nr:hypothetical protein [Neorhodopirellula pilleata]TWT93723.1 hypothetical protein Pla100_42410 [Neorhodopirellula pilleata]